MEELEKVQKEVSDVGAEIIRVSVQAESAKDAEDKRSLQKEKLLLLEIKVTLQKKELLLLEELHARGMRGPW